MLSKRSGYFFLKCILKPKTYYNFYLGSEGDGKVIGGTKATKGKQRTVLWQPYVCPFIFLGDTRSIFYKKQSKNQTS